MAHHSVVHTIAWKANGDVSALLFRSVPENPDPSEIDRVCKYVLCYGCKGVEPPKIRREMWRDAVLGYDERSDAKAICTKLLNATAARRMITKAERMVEAGNHPLWGCTAKFKKASLSGFRKLLKDGETGAHTTPVAKYRSRPVGDGHVALYEYVGRSGGGPCFTGASLRPKFPPSECFARAMPLLHKPWREADDLRGDPEGARIPEFNRFVEFESCPLALKVSAERARAATRAQRPLGGSYAGRRCRPS